MAIVRLSEVSPSWIVGVRDLFRAYAESLPFDLGFQGFYRELETLPGPYAPPTGELLIAIAEEEAIGCVAFRRLDAETCEMKRLFVSPGYRGAGVGSQLIEKALAEAKRRGYTRMRLDTVASMIVANHLYRRFGFKGIPPYCYNPLEGAGYFEKTL